MSMIFGKFHEFELKITITWLKPFKHNRHEHILCTTCVDSNTRNNFFIHKTFKNIFQKYYDRDKIYDKIKSMFETLN